MLGDAAGEARDGGPVCAVDMKGDEVIAMHARRPGRVDLRDDAAFQLERRIGRIIGIRMIASAALIDARIDVSRPAAADRLDLAEQIVEHVPPVRQHVENDAPAVRLAIVPGRALRGLKVALEHPIAELAPHREDAAEEARVPQHAQLAQSGQEQLVLHHAVLDAP